MSSAIHVDLSKRQLVVREDGKKARTVRMDLNTLETVIRPSEPQLDILTRLLNPPTQAQVCN